MVNSISCGSVSIKQHCLWPDLLQPRKRKPKISRKNILTALHAIVERNDWKPFMNQQVRVTDGEKDFVAVLRPEDLPLFRQVRRISASHCNQHTLDDYANFSQILLALTWSPPKTATPTK